MGINAIGSLQACSLDKSSCCLRREVLRLWSTQRDIVIHGYYITEGKRGFMLHIHFEFILKQVNHSIQPQEFMFYTQGVEQYNRLEHFKEQVQ